MMPHGVGPTGPLDADRDDPLKPERWWAVYDWCRDIQQLAQKVSERVDSFANAIPDQRSASAPELGAVKSDGESEPPQIALLAVPPEGVRPPDTTKGPHEVPSCPDGAVRALAGVQDIAAIAW